MLGDCLCSERDCEEAEQPPNLRQNVCQNFFFYSNIGTGRSLRFIQSNYNSVSSSENSDTDRSERSGLISIPSPVLLSDASDDGVSPSQHKLAMKNQMAYHEVVANSTSGSDEEEKEEDEE